MRLLSQKLKRCCSAMPMHRRALSTQPLHVGSSVSHSYGSLRRNAVEFKQGDFFCSFSMDSRAAGADVFSVNIYFTVHLGNSVGI